MERDYIPFLSSSPVWEVVEIESTVLCPTTISVLLCYHHSKLFQKMLKNIIYFNKSLPLQFSSSYQLFGFFFFSSQLKLIKKLASATESQFTSLVHQRNIVHKNYQRIILRSLQKANITMMSFKSFL